MPEPEEWAGDPFAWPSEPLRPCPLLWALGGSHCWLQWYRDTTPDCPIPCSYPVAVSLPISTCSKGLLLLLLL